MTAAVKTIFAHADPTEVAAQWDRVTDTLAGSFPKVAAMMSRPRPMCWRSPRSRRPIGR
ncbi:transposase, Mutator family protein [Mycobacterium kansasii 662]|uniref:Transposase, Mutator family protein n=3 Tax=Mycobacterium kansasii TaxID=1768 RepID=A0A1V3XKS0_MYCKA|nr:hypothetical protein MKAN_09255 [Mycobacterium kansasii ATCC 12478]EUA01228.1 transposase, Mutator family protein [Mycobacterium kansasii 824]EUA18048.1 transposase, Mutator family protein [Mycobacterium kansasii 662]KEP39566.1 hypothetical protein MKSMC1_53170 [Mycobacterium kansasii]OOK74887.1 transposase, Mutator family protein [Mycobacterium kansasii]